MTDKIKFKKTMVATPAHQWLLISVFLMTFVILPLLFVWSSLGIIHNRTGDGVLLTDAMAFLHDNNGLHKTVDQTVKHRNES